MWRYTGQHRPDFAIEPLPGQESVWDYPRPPGLVSDGRKVDVYSDSDLIASSINTYRVLETAHPPAFYIPPQDVNRDVLSSAPGSSICEWKGASLYWILAANPDGGIIGWSYPDPTPSFDKIRDYISFYPALVECYVAGERVRAQPGQFYGGWITDEVIGPFKGQPGTEGW